MPEGLGRKPSAFFMGRKVKSPERERERQEREKREEKIMPLIVATYVCNAARAAHALCSYQFIQQPNILFSFSEYALN